MGWAGQDSLEVRTRLEALIPVFHQRVCAVPQMDIKLGVPSTGISWWHGVLHKESMSYRQHLEQILQIPARTSREHCISSTATPSANDATPQTFAAYKQRPGTLLLYCI